MDAIFDDATINHYAHERMRYIINRLIGRFGFTRSDRDDLKQLLALTLLEAMPHFDSTRGSITTFISRVLEHKARSLIRFQTAKKRDPARVSSLDAAANTVADAGDLIRDGIRRLRCQASRQSRTDAAYVAIDGMMNDCANSSNPMGISATVGDVNARLDLQIDVSAAVEALPDQMQKIARGLVNGSMSSVARELGISRATVRRQVDALREIFERNGLRDYL